MIDSVHDSLFSSQSKVFDPTHPLLRLSGVQELLSLLFCLRPQPLNLLHEFHYCPSLKDELCVMNGIK